MICLFVFFCFCVPSRKREGTLSDGEELASGQVEKLPPTRKKKEREKKEMETPTTTIGRHIREEWFQWDVESKSEKWKALMRSIAHLKQLETSTRKELQSLTHSQSGFRPSLMDFHRIHHMLVVQLVSLKAKRQFLEKIAFALKQNLQDELDILQMI